ncbi:MAG TPA: AMP-binding protein [Streptosporangiaceae bacterium]|nr:AMP-binding protein [Streptosporangiaceae bacterium]
MELEISAGAGIEAELRTLHADAQQRAWTEHILALADQAGYGAALIDAVALGHAEAAVITWPQFAHMVRTAARGLSRRGLQEGDTAGIFVGDAISHAVAVHAVRTAGAVAATVRPTRSAADIAAQLKQDRVRLLITSAELADLAIQAAERSWVRQVFAFGEAEGTTPFDSLLQTPRRGQHQADDSTSHNGHADGPTPRQAFDLDELGLGADQVAPQLIRRPVPRLTWRDVVVATPPCGDPEAYTSLLDLALAAGATVVAAPLTQVTAALGVYKGTAAIVPRGTDVPGLPQGRVLAVG